MAGEAIPEFSMTEASVEAGWEKEDAVTNRSRSHEAFTVSSTRLFINERRTGKTFEVKGLPLGWRPFSDLTWANDRTLMFDRWSQPHFGVHYAVNAQRRKLIAAVPFPDKWQFEQGRPKRRTLKHKSSTGRK